MRRLKYVAFLLSAGLLTLLPAKAETTILERDRSDRQAPAEKLVPPTTAQPTKPDAPENVTPFTPFVLRTLQVEGSSLSDATIKSASAPYIGQTMDRAAIDALAKEISAAYGKSDVALYSVFVPNQTGENGVLRVVVIEGVIDEVLVSGDTARRNLVYAQRILAPVVNEKPLRRSTLERSLALLSAVPGLKLESKFLKTNQRGVVKLAVGLKNEPFQAGIGVSTRGTTELGDTSFSADANLNSLFQAGDRTTAAFGAPVDMEQFRYYSLAHQMPLNADGLNLSANVGYLTTNPSNTPVSGKAISAGVQMSYPLLLSFTRALSVGIGFDGLNSDNAFLGEGVSSDRTRAARFSASYFRVDDGARLSAGIALSKGLNVLGAEASDPIASDLAFFKVTAQASYDYPVRKQLLLRLNTAAQYSSDALPGAEQASLGGEAFGRAFDSAVVTGDKNIAGSLELAYLFADLPTPFSTPEVYAYVDGGQVWRTTRGAIPGSETGLASAGFGARLTLFSHVALGVEMAQPLVNPDTDPDEDGWRFIFSFSATTGS